MGFREKLGQFEGKCRCWHCLRAAGLTPPMSSRHNFPAISPYAVFGRDEGGEPIRTAGRGKEGNEDKVGATAEENYQLREAVRNRSAI